MSHTKKIEALRAALSAARDVIALCDTPRPISDPRLYRIAEQLGRDHGYGALMQAVQHAWHDRMRDGDPLHKPGAEHTCGPCQDTVTRALADIDAALTQDHIQ